MHECVSRKPWTDGWRWLLACVVIGGLPLLNGPARAIALGVLGALYLLTLTSIKQGASPKRRRVKSGGGRP